MRRYIRASSVRALASAGGLLCLAACAQPVPPHPPETASALPTATSSTSAPMPPPSPYAELVPPPPEGDGPKVWQPGHWSYTGLMGTPWEWEQGKYVAPPSGASTWVPGKWAEQSGGGWVWRDGHWA